MRKRLAEQKAEELLRKREFEIVNALEILENVIPREKRSRKFGLSTDDFEQSRVQPERIKPVAIDVSGYGRVTFLFRRPILAYRKWRNYFRHKPQRSRPHSAFADRLCKLKSIWQD
jgi:hypothetical protein